MLRWWWCVNHHDPIELPIFQYLKQQHGDSDLESYRQLCFTSFDLIRKRTEATIEKNGERFEKVTVRHADHGTKVIRYWYRG